MTVRPLLSAAALQPALLALLVACGTPAESAETPAPEPAPAVAQAPAAEAAPAAQAGPPARGDDSTRKSKNGTATMKLGDVDVTVTYGRPEARGRAIFGDLIPYGKVWRTGADEASVLTVSGDVMLGDVAVPAGSYALFTIPGEEEWTILLNSQPEQWGSYSRDPGKDVAKAMAKPEKAEMTEAFTIEEKGGALVMRWAETQVAIPLKPRG